MSPILQLTLPRKEDNVEAVDEMMSWKASFVRSDFRNSDPSSRQVSVGVICFFVVH
jgi:hypothetical protein